MTVDTLINQKPFSKEKPFGGKKQLYNVVTVQFRTNHLKEDVDARELLLSLHDEVIVDTQRGPAIARVTSHIHRKVVAEKSLPKVLRKATETDIKQAKRNEDLEIEAYRFAIERVRARKLPMKLVRAQYMQDGSKIVFYFSADGRIDFRDLVKDLAHRFRTRIEMHQIGVRDGTRMLGGIGPCGRELCCSTFLENFAPVSIRMAKDQGLTLNPKKVSGMCGRLMCCLVYEQQIYRRMRSKLPRPGQQVATEQGRGQIIDIDIINRRATIGFEDHNRKTFAIDEIKVLDSRRIDDTVDEDAGDNDTDLYMWDDAIAADDGVSSKSSRRKSSRRRSNRRRSSSKRPRHGRSSRSSGGNDSQSKNAQNNKITDDAKQDSAAANGSRAKKTRRKSASDKQKNKRSKSTRSNSQKPRSTSRRKKKPSKTESETKK